MITSPRLLMTLLAAAALGCARPAIESAGAGGNGGGDNAGGEGGSGAGGAGGRGAGGRGGSGAGGNLAPGGFGDGGARDMPPSSTIDPENPSCAGELHQGKQVPLDLMLLVDISGSMEEGAGMKSKWAAVRDALVSFTKEPKSSGIGVGLMTFPPLSKKCTSTAECGAGGYCEEKGMCGTAAAIATTEPACNDQMECVNGFAGCTKYGVCAKSGLRCVANASPCAAGDSCGPRPSFCTYGPNASCPVSLYQMPLVPVGDLPGSQSALEMALAGIVPQGTTPTTPAVTGALTQLRARAMANPDRKQVLVLATDGLPTECGFMNTVQTAVTAISGGQMGMPSIPTYVIGVFGSNQIARARPALNQLATAGGTMTPFVLEAGNDLTQEFLDAINKIRGSALGCEYALPPAPAGMNLDYGKVNVRVTKSAGPEDLVYVGGADKCDPTSGGWYYDADPKTTNPTRVLLCPTTCSQVKMVAVSVELRVGCNTIIK